MKMFEGICVCIMILFLWFLILELHDLPIVYWSTSKDECVKVVIKGDDCACDNYFLGLKKYERIWVK